MLAGGGWVLEDRRWWVCACAIQRCPGLRRSAATLRRTAGETDGWAYLIIRFQCVTPWDLRQVSVAVSRLIRTTRVGFLWSDSGDPVCSSSACHAQAAHTIMAASSQLHDKLRLNPTSPSCDGDANIVPGRMSLSVLSLKLL
jgi:hypothetical protein